MADWLSNLSSGHVPTPVYMSHRRRHMTVESMMEKASLQQMKYRVVLYGCDTSAEMRLASLLYTTVAKGP